jgi:hypothetical protein
VETKYVARKTMVITMPITKVLIKPSISENRSRQCTCFAKTGKPITSTGSRIFTEKKPT